MYSRDLGVLTTKEYRCYPAGIRAGETELGSDGGVIRVAIPMITAVTIDRPYGDGSTGTITSNRGGRNVDVTGTRVVEGCLEDLTVLDLGSTRGGSTTEVES